MTFPTLKTIEIGAYANDGTGDDLRTAFKKVNENFASLFTDLGVVSAISVGNGESVFAQKNTTTNNLEFKSLVAGSGVTLASDATTVTINAGLTRIEQDTLPTLGGDLNLNGHIITGGDVQTTVFGRNVEDMYQTIQVLAGNDLDFGPILGSSATTFDFGVF
jgi:hypothetical protein